MGWVHGRMQVKGGRGGLRGGLQGTQQSGVCDRGPLAMAQGRCVAHKPCGRLGGHGERLPTPRLLPTPTHAAQVDALAHKV